MLDTIKCLLMISLVFVLCDDFADVLCLIALFMLADN